MINYATAHPAASRSSIVDFLPAALLCFIGFCSLAAAYLLSGQNSNQYLVITAPHVSFAYTFDVLRKADAQFVAKGYFDNIVIAATTQDNFPVIALKSGAWLAVPVPAQANCATAFSQEKTS